MEKIRNFEIEDDNGSYEDLMTIIDGLGLCPLSHNALVGAINNYAARVDVDAYIRGAIERPEVTESVNGVVVNRYNAKVVQ